MNEMIERVARALVEHRMGKGAPVMDEGRKEARAAIAAMREPTEAMRRQIARDDWMGRSDLSWTDGYRIMIEAALAEPPA